MSDQLLPQRFKHRPTATSCWYYGCCFYIPARNRWFVAAQTADGYRGLIEFDTDPWEVIGQVIAGDDAELRWIDNDMGWRDTDDH